MLEGGKIYCFGGQTGAGDSLRKYASLFSLDTSKVQGDYASHWEQITDTINSEIYTACPRSRASLSVTEDKKNMIIIGGQFTPTNGTPTHNVVYNVDTKTWRALPNFDDGENGNNRQIQTVSSTWVPDQSKLYLFGGTEVYTTRRWYYDSLYEKNLTNVQFTSSNRTSKIGYYHMTTLNIAANASEPWQVPAQENAPVLAYYMQEPVYHPTSKKIFYFGGMLNNATTEELTATQNVSMSEILTFDTVTNTWGTQNFTGELIPTPRRSHTVTLLSSGHDILLYGGTLNDRAYGLPDFCYTANLQTFVWKSCNTITLPNKENPSRTEHAAVLDESKNIVYILFGYQDTKAMVNTFDTMLAVNVTDLAHISFVDTNQHLSTAAETPTPVTNDTETASPTPSPSKNGRSATIGGAVGGSLGGVLIIGVVAFFIWRKKRAERKAKQARDAAERISVDWDAMEGGGYTETYTMPTNEKDQHYRSVTKPSGDYPLKAENEQYFVKINGSGTTTSASLPVPDIDTMKAALVPDGGADSDLMTKPDVCADDGKREK
ncbi:60S ribosomal protein L10 [Mucor velutinosus]|uniref:60S ribosomal protein L10 n=1 Tax=Mucor velutinosus TaxID=708070 RepID=A0AAN7DDD8_9FUNG|nr:60S ribosomal protein L10 [Mucor velutinosus]